MATNVSTGTVKAQSLAYPNQRKLDHCQNGVLWAAYTELQYIYFFYSTDGGSTWTWAGNPGGTISTGTGVNNYVVDASIFIDLDDYCHVSYKDATDGKLYYVRGTPNAGRTSWTWNTPVVYANSTSYDYPDIVAHREGTGWKVHMVWSYADGTPSNLVEYRRLNITSGGVITSDSYVQISSNYAQNSPCYPSLDFNHNGDGKTVGGSTPHIYAAWTAAVTGAGNGIRFKKAAYSAGVWTWGTEREIDNTVKVKYYAQAWDWINCIFDGTRVLIGGQVEDTTPTFYAKLWERDAADTTTTTRINVTLPSTSQYLDTGSITYDSVGNAYMWGGDEHSVGLVYYKYNRSGNSVTGPTASSTSAATPSSAADEAYVTLMRGNSGGKLRWIYKDGTPSSWTIKYDSLSVLTNISLSRVFKWNTRASISLARIFKWNTKGTISLSRVFKWNTDKTISLSRIFKWNTRGQISVSRIFKWNTKQTITPVRTFLWNTRQAVSTSRVFKWNTRSAVTPSTRIFKWNVKQTITASRIFKWNTKETITASRTFVWNTRAQVPVVSRTFVWNTRLQVTVSRTFLWITYQTISITRTFKWHVYIGVMISRTFLWRVRAQIIASRTFRWNVYRPWVPTEKAPNIWTEDEPTVDVWTELERANTGWR